MKKFVIIISALGLMTLIACGGEKPAEPSASSNTPAKEEVKKEATETAAKSNRKGRLIYKQYCVICHGADGKLGVSGAKDLSASTITLEERINQITNGKGLMTPYKDILSEDQIQSVAEYLDELRK